MASGDASQSASFFLGSIFALGQIVVHTRTPSFPSSSCRPLVVVGEYVAIVRDEDEFVTHLLDFDYLMGALRVEIACR